MKLFLTGIAIVVVIFVVFQFNGDDSDSAHQDDTGKQSIVSPKAAPISATDALLKKSTESISPAKSPEKAGPTSYPSICIEENEKIKGLTDNELEEIVKSQTEAYSEECRQQEKLLLPTTYLKAFDTYCTNKAESCSRSLILNRGEIFSFVLKHYDEFQKDMDLAFPMRIEARKRIKELAKVHSKFQAHLKQAPATKREKIASAVKKIAESIKSVQEHAETVELIASQLFVQKLIDKVKNGYSLDQMTWKEDFRKEFLHALYNKSDDEAASKQISEQL